MTGPSLLSEVRLIKPNVHIDRRGFFFESWHRRRYNAPPFVQDNVSFSQQGVVRGLHFQHPHGQGKLVSVLTGSVFDVAVDVRVGSAHFGKWVGYELSFENHFQLYIPPGFAHGFRALSPSAIVHYKCSTYYNKDHELGIAYNDPDIGIEWPDGIADEVVISEKDNTLPFLRNIDVGLLPTISYVGAKI